MEVSQDTKERLQRLAKIGIVAGAAGGVAVKIFHKEDGWGYTHVTDKASIYLGYIKEGKERLAQVAGALNNSVADILGGAEPDIDWDSQVPTDEDVNELERYISEENRLT